MAIKYDSNFTEGDLLPSSVVNNIIDSIKENETNINKKMDKVDGKGLSTNDYTDAEKQKNADNAEKIELLTLSKTEFDEIYGDGVIPKDYKIYKALTNFKVQGDTTSTLNSGVEWYTNGYFIQGINRSLNEDGSPINYNLYDGTNVKITYGSKNVTAKIFDISVKKLTGEFINFPQAVSNSTCIACSLDSNVTKSLDLPTDVEGSVKYTKVSIEFVNDTNNLQIKKNDFIRHTTHGWDLISRIVDIDNELIDYIKNTDYASESMAGVAKVKSIYGAYVSSADGTLQLMGATDNNITQRNTAYRPITPANLNTAVRAALTDSKRISDMSSLEKLHARGVIDAEQETFVSITVFQIGENVKKNFSITIPYLDKKSSVNLIDEAADSLTITVKNSVSLAYECLFNLISGPTATTISAPADIIKFVGVDCDNDGNFIPSVNTNYEISIKNIGTNETTPVLVARVGAY